MASNTTINTRIILRNDELSNWVNANPVLRTGEVALARRADGTYDMRIGNITETGEGGVPVKMSFNELSNSLMISAQQVIGLEDTIGQLSTTHYTSDDLAKLSNYADYHNGDTAIVSVLIAGEGANAKYSYTAYIWDASLTGNNKWSALDGNYRADNVYFDSNITCEGTYTNVGNVNKGTTLSAAGKSLEEVMTLIFTKELTAAISANPSVTINTSVNTVEYGSEQTPHYSFTFNHGIYKYGPSPTGTEILSWTVKTNGNTLEGLTATTDTITDSDVACNPALITATFSGNTLTASIYTISASVSYSQGDVPKTNLGNDDTTPGNRIQAGSKTNSKSIFNVYRPTFWIVTTTRRKLNENLADLEALGLDGAATTADLVSKGWTKLNGTSKTNYTITTNWYNICFLAPSFWKTSWSGIDTSTNIPVNSMSNIPITFKYVNGESSTDNYTLFWVDNADPADPTTVTMTFE